MKALYFDCFSGISGDMTLGALLDLGVDREEFLAEMEKLGIGGYQIAFEKAVKNGITGNYVRVHLDENLMSDEASQQVQGQHLSHSHGHEHGQRSMAGQEHTHHSVCGGAERHGEEYTVEFQAHHHSHSHRGLKEIEDLIKGSGIKDGARDLALRIFRRVAEAEAKVHGRPVEEVHFHEVGAVDSIVDIVGCAILIDMIQPDKVYASVVSEGRGFIHCQHGRLPVPVPAVSEIFSAAGVTFRQIDEDTELVTPTGAAIIAELAQSFGNMPVMRVLKTGWGAGTKNLKQPNLLKVTMGELPEDENSEETGEVKLDIGENLSVTVMETNLDDCTGEQLGYAMELLFEAGALDVFFTSIFMKKNRPAYLLTVICAPDKEQRMESILFLHTTTIGIRKRRESRSICPRKPDVLQTVYGEVQVKRVELPDRTRIYPEYESAKKLAKEQDVPLSEIYRQVSDGMSSIL